jgi:hypothetical protein
LWLAGTATSKVCIAATTPSFGIGPDLGSGTAKVEGDAGILKQLASTMVDFDPRFEIMPGTKQRIAEVVHADPYQGGA